MTTMHTVKTALAAVALHALGGSVWAMDAPMPVKTAKVAVPSVQIGDPRADARRVRWAGWETSLKAGDRIGSAQAVPAACTQQREWSELLARRAGAEMQQALDDELARARNLPRQTAPVEVSAVLNDFAQNLCSEGNGQWHGGFSLRVSWTVRQAGSSKVLYRGTTKGSFNTAQSTERPPAYALRDAFAMSVRGLLADNRFVAALQPNGNAAIASR